jgi:hypothetical protein
MQPCDRQLCSYSSQNGAASGCDDRCFQASCDFAKLLCSEIKKQLLQCPAFDSSAYASYVSEPRLNFPESSSLKGSIALPGTGGSYLGFGRCALDSNAECEPAHEGPADAYIFAASLYPGSNGISLLGLGNVSQTCYVPASPRRPGSDVGVYACTPALQWAWAKGGPQLSRTNRVMTVQVSIYVRMTPSNNSVIVSSETFGLGIANAGNGTGVLSLRVGESSYVRIHECPLRIGEWIHLAVSLFAASREINGALTMTTLVYMNGSQIHIPRKIEFSESANFSASFAMENGLAVGRDFPTAQYLTNNSTLSNDGSSYFVGLISRMRLWSNTEAGEVAALRSSQSCVQAAKIGGLVACYDFNNTLEDFLGTSSLSLRLGDKYRPWCRSVDDNGQFLYHPSVTINTVYDMGERWGFCTASPVLPSRGRDFNVSEMTQVNRMSSTELLSQYPSCGRLPFVFRNNRALKRYGGAIYQSRYVGTNSIGTSCFLGMSSGLQPAYQLLFESNAAGAAGGAIYIDGPYVDKACASVLRQQLGLPMPHAEFQVRFVGNSAGGWGPDVATAPSSIRVVSSVLAYVPGIDTLDVEVALADGLHQAVRGSDTFVVPYVVKVMVCSQAAQCTDLSSLVPSSYFGCDQSGLCSTKKAATSKSTSLPCLVNQSGVVAVLSYALSNTASASVNLPLRCLPCSEGQQMSYEDLGDPTLSQQKWQCNACGPGMTIIDPNNAQHRCIACPFDAVCPGSGPALFGVSTVDVTFSILGNITYNDVTGGTREFEGSLLSALRTLLPVASDHIMIHEPLCTEERQCIAARRAAHGESIPFTFRIMLPIDMVQNASQKIVSSRAWMQTLMAMLLSNGFAVSINETQFSVVATNPLLGDWEIVDGAYLLRGCRPGYLLVNITFDTQQCIECYPGTYSLDSGDGCVGRKCAWRSCTQCPSGASCSRGSSPSWSHFVPRVLYSKQGPIPTVTLIVGNAKYVLFFADSPDRYLWTDNSPLEAQSSSQYVWEYVKECSPATQPCDPAAVPAFLLRLCPPGHTHENSSRGLDGFNSALQDCIACPLGQYVIDPEHPPCIDCPRGGRCDAGVFQPVVQASVWEKVGLHWRVSGCPLGYVLVRLPPFRHSLVIYYRVVLHRLVQCLLLCIFK